MFRKMSKASANIKQYMLEGNLNKEIPVDLMNGLILYIDLFLKEGFSLTQIKEVSTIGQILADQSVLERVKSELQNCTFQGGYSTKNFDIEESYIDLMQITMVDNKSYAVAYNSPAEYLGTFTGIIWVLELKKRLKVGEIPNTHIDFIR